MREFYKYTFDDRTDLEELEDTLLMSVLAAEGLHGCARVRLDASYRINRHDRTCLVRCSTEVGLDVCRIFTGLLLRTYGAEKFQVQQLDFSPTTNSEEIPT